jgi:RNA-directed DNA polymerase
MDKKDWFPTPEGTPQGGVISPLLANIALHGMENCVKDFAETLKLYTPKGNQISKINRRNSISLIRYADDFVIFHEDLTVVQRCKEIISEWLLDIGLELKPSKTRLAHTLNEYEGEKAGFDFLGWTTRQFRVGKYRNGRNTIKEALGFTTIIKPSKKSIKRHYEKIAETIDKHKAVSQVALINHLNPIIRGWCNYHRTVSSKEIFSGIDNLIFWKLWKWGVRRHNNKGKIWVKDKYWKTIGKDNWVFATREGDNPYKLLKHSQIKVDTKYVKVKGEKSPYDGNLIYWSARMGKHPEMPNTKAEMLKKQKGKCTLCGLHFKEGDLLEIDHIIPKSKGGKNEFKNYQLLHRHCHDIKTTKDPKKTPTLREFDKAFEEGLWVWKDDMPTMVETY